jgi:hypothetical protein
VLPTRGTPKKGPSCVSPRWVSHRGRPSGVPQWGSKWDHTRGLPKDSTKGGFPEGNPPRISSNGGPPGGVLQGGPPMWDPARETLHWNTPWDQSLRPPVNPPKETPRGPQGDIHRGPRRSFGGCGGRGEWVAVLDVFQSFYLKIVRLNLWNHVSKTFGRFTPLVPCFTRLFVHCVEFQHFHVGMACCWCKVASALTSDSVGCCIGDHSYQHKENLKL